MGKILVFAEKPPMAQDIANALAKKTGSAFKRKAGYHENDFYVITNGIGHLIQAKMPSEYEEFAEQPNNGWNWSAIPFYPKDNQLVFRPSPGKTDQLKIVKELYARKDIDEVINACDAGREGELIFWLTYHYCKAAQPVKRWWGRDLTEKGILKGFDNLYNEDFFLSKKDAAYSRQFADWALGNNLTVAFTLKGRQMNPNVRKLTLHIGRVQTPTLALLVQRRLEIEQFKPEEFFEIEATFGSKYKGQWFKEKLSHTKFDKKEQAQAVLDKIKGQTGIVTKKEVVEKAKSHPLLYSLNTLSMEAASKFGFSPQKTLDIVQVLYEKYKATSYPRTDSEYLTTDFADTELIPALRAVNQGEYAVFAEKILQKEVKTTSRFVNNKKVSDHHAIVPTMKKVDLHGFKDETVGKTFVKGTEIRKIYDLIVRRFLCVFFPDAIYEKTDIVTEVAGETFKTNGNILVSPGWKEVYGADPAGGEEEEGEGEGDNKDVTLPKIEKEEENPVTKEELKEKKTQPPKPYTVSELLKTMDNPRKFIEDKDLKEAMRDADAGLGTAATRAAHIEKLIEREYVEKKGSAYHPTDFSMKLISLAPENLKSPIVTADWEQKLKWIEEGKISKEEFESGILSYVRENIENLKNSEVVVTFAGANDAQTTEYVCLKCKGNMRKVKYEKLDYYICEHHTKETPCMRLYEKTLGKKLTKKQIEELLTNGETKAVVKGLKSQKGAVYDAQIKMDMELKRAIPVFPENNQPRSKETDIKCPFCEGKIQENSKAFGCDSFKQKKSCGFTVWKNNSQKLDLAQIQKLITENQTDVIDDMQSPKGTYSAYYVLDRQTKKIERKYANSK